MTESGPGEIRPGLFRWALVHPRFATAIFAAPVVLVAVVFFVHPAVKAVVDRVRWAALLDDADFRPREDAEGAGWGVYQMRQFLARRLGVSSRTIQGTGTPVLLFEGRDEVAISREETAGAAARAAREWTQNPFPDGEPSDRRHEAWGRFVFSGRGGSPGIDRILELLSGGESRRSPDGE